jgi:hypothetical protein
MASKGHTIESWEPSPWTHAPNANVANEQTMTSLQAQAARAKSAEVMAALKKGEPGDADKLLVSLSLREWKVEDVWMDGWMDR